MGGMTYPWKGTLQSSRSCHGPWPAVFIASAVLKLAGVTKQSGVMKCPSWDSSSSVIEAHAYHSPSVSLSVVSNSLTPGTIAHQAPLSMGFSTQEYWSG